MTLVLRQELVLKSVLFVSQQDPKFESKMYTTSCWLHYYGLSFVPEEHSRCHHSTIPVIYGVRSQTQDIEMHSE